MAQDKPKLIFSEGLVLPDGRKVRVLAYDTGAVRFRLDGTPYVMDECFLGGGRNNFAILRLSPGRQGAAAYTGRVQGQAVSEGD